jgi:hypothetical protein
VILRRVEDAQEDRLGWGLLVAAMALASALLLWEGRGLTFFVDEWSFGYLGRTGLGLSELLEPDNGHLAAIPVLITKASLELFGADTALPLRVVAVAIHLVVVLFLYIFVRRHLGPLWALPPAILVLFLGAASDIIVGSHAIPIELAVAAGLGAWLALGMRSTAGDLLAAALFLVGILSNGFALPFLAGAVAIVLIDPDRRPSRLWVVAVPVGVYALWWLGYGHDGESGFAVRNLAGLGAFAFDSLSADLAALTGLFVDPGASDQSFQLGPGQALAGAALVALSALAVAGRLRAPREAVPALIALLTLWVATGLVAGPARQPESARYVYTGVVLILVAAAPLIASAPQRRRASFALAAVCAVALLPNLREINYGADFFRMQSDIDRAVLGAIDLSGARAPAILPIETADDQVPGAVSEMGSPIGRYREARERYGTPAFTETELSRAPGHAREAADRLLARVLGLWLSPVQGPPAALPARLPVEALGGSVLRRAGCLAFEPESAGALLVVPVPPRGLWIEPDPGPAASVMLRRFGDGFVIDPGAALPGRPSLLRMPAAEVGRDWKAQLAPQQRIVVCGL